MDEFDRTHAGKITRVPHPFEKDKFILIGYGVRNEELTVKRVINVLTITNKLCDLLNEASRELNEDNLAEKIAGVKKLLEDGLQNNKQLSAIHGKDHRSFNQNRLLGLGFFSSWWHKTWF